MSPQAEHPHGHDHPPPPGPASLRSRGRRLTRQRELVWEALTATPDTHLSAEQIAAYVHQHAPSVNATTIYRSLDVLVTEGLVLRTELGADRSFYEPAHEHRHHHVVCRDCGKVTHLHDDLFGELPARVNAASGYVLGTDEITLFGHCPACREPSDDLWDGLGGENATCPHDDQR